MSNAATPIPETFEDEWAKLNLAPCAVRGRADLQEAALIMTIVRPELAITGELLTRTALAPFGCEEMVIKHVGREDRSAGKLGVPKPPIETRNDEQGPSGSRKNDIEKTRRNKMIQPDDPIEQDPEQAGKIKPYNFLEEA